MKKAQSSFEFLSTYSIALFLAFGAVLLLGYIAIQPDAFVSETCIINEDFICEDYRIESDGNLTLLLRNGVGRTVTLQYMECLTEVGIFVNNAELTVEAGELFEYSCLIEGLNFPGKIRVDLDIRYQQINRQFPVTVSGNTIVEFEP